MPISDLYNMISNGKLAPGFLEYALTVGPNDPSSKHLSEMMKGYQNFTPTAKTPTVPWNSGSYNPLTGAWGSAGPSTTPAPTATPAPAPQEAPSDYPGVGANLQGWLASLKTVASPQQPTMNDYLRYISPGYTGGM